MKHPHPETFLTADDAAAYLCVSPSLLEKWRAVGRGPAYCRLGRRVVYARSDLVEWAFRTRIEERR